MVGAIGGSGNGWGQFKKAMEEFAEKVRQANQNSGSTTAKVTEASTPAATTPVAASEPVASVQPAVETTPAAAATAPAPVIASDTAVVDSDGVSLSPSLSPLTYSASTPAPRSQPVAAPETTLDTQLSDAGYYASPAASAVADPVAPAQQEDAAALSQAQVIAQAAYALVARAGEDHRLSLIQQG